MKSFIKNVKYSDSAKAIGTHYHDTHQILYVVSGSATVTVDGEDFGLEGGSVLFISRMESHSVSDVSDDYRRYELRLSPQIITAADKDYTLYSVLTNRPKNFSRHFKDVPKNVSDCFLRIASEFEKDGMYKEMMLSHSLDMLLCGLYRQNPDMFGTVKQPSVETVQSIQREFESNIAAAYTLDALCEKYHISKYYLSHIFKQVTGYAVMDYLKTLRIARAKTLLAKTRTPIGEITALCGFSDPANFGREFKKITGETPKGFRNRFI